jgi:endonuclease YncB( thermonuclease family)
VYGKTVNVPDIKLDRYGRTVSRVFFGNFDASLEMIKAGMAWHFKKYELEQRLDDRLRYNAAEVIARDTKLGLWSQGTAKRPEDFRSESKSVKTAHKDADCPCGFNNFCNGAHGGQYCINVSGNKKYASQ